MGRRVHPHGRGVARAHPQGGNRTDRGRWPSRPLGPGGRAAHRLLPGHALQRLRQPRRSCADDRSPAPRPARGAAGRGPVRVLAAGAAAAARRDLPQVHEREPAPVEPAVRTSHAGRQGHPRLVPHEARRPHGAHRGGAHARHEFDPAARQRAARVLWAGVHGITSLSTADKLSNITSEAAGPLVHDLVSTYLAGLTIQRPDHA